MNSSELNNGIREPVAAWLSVRKEKIVQDIVSLVNIESVSEPGGCEEEPFGSGCRRVLEIAIGMCSTLGFNARDHENYCASFLWEGETSEELGIFGHLDVVPAGPGWTSDPYSASVTEEIIIGRGSSDNKGSVVAVLYALKYLKETGYKPKNSIRMFLGCNEENGMEDIEFYLKNHPIPAFSFTPDAAFPVCFAEKGILNISASYRIAPGGVLADFSAGTAKNAVPGEAYALLVADMDELKRRLPEASLEQQGDYVKLSAEGIAAHSAFPDGSINAETVLAELLLRSGLLDKSTEGFMKAVLKIFGDYYGAGIGVPWEDSVSGRLTHTGSMVRMLNGVFRQHINIRYNIEADRRLLLQRIRHNLESVGFSIDEEDDNPPGFFPREHTAVQQLTDLVNRSLGLHLKPYVMGGGTYARKLKNAVGFGPGNPTDEKRFGSDRGGAHQPDEYVEISSLLKAAEIYIEAIPLIDRLISENKI